MVIGEMIMGRYSLITTLYRTEKIIKIKEFDNKSGKYILKQKVDLPTIDKYTSCFDSAYDYNTHHLFSSNANSKIVYQSKGQIKTIPCVFGDNPLIGYFANTVKENDGKSEISIEDPYFREVVKKFLLAICYPSYRNFVFSDRNINLYVKNKVEDYIKMNANDKFITEKLMMELQKYKNLRSVIFNMQKYEKIKQIILLGISVPIAEYNSIPTELEITRFIPSEEIEEPNFAPNSEEERMYEKYLTSLPTEDFSLKDPYQLKK